MKKNYTGKNRLSKMIFVGTNRTVPQLTCKYLQIFVVLFFFIAPINLNAQKLQLSYSYFNLTRNTGGGTTEPGDIIEIHALAYVKATTKSFYYLDTIPAGTTYVSNSMKLTTNEGVVFSGGGPFTDAPGDDRAMYNATPNAIRINLGKGYTNVTAANFNSTAGGGTVSTTDIPKFYGATLFIVTYQLLVTASYGDTIFPTGNFHFDTTSGINPKWYRFNYPGIKIQQNSALCSNYLGASFSAESSFGSGTTQNRGAGATVPGYTKVNIGANAPQDNYYSIVNNSSADGTTNNAGPYVPTANAHRVFGGYWDIIGDHTGAASPSAGNLPVTPGTPGGYMLLVNSAFTTGEAYRDTIRNVCPNTIYEFSAWIRNICGYCGIDSNSAATYKPGVLPNLAFTINDIDYYTTGNITYDSIWEKHGFLYKTGPAETSFRITIKNNAAGGGGNDWVLDDIELATCYPNLINSPKDTASSCVGVPINLSDTVKSYFNTYTDYCWERSTDGINWTSTGNCSSRVPILINGQWVYHVDTAFMPTAADSGTYYRLKVATTGSNLSDPNCSVTNSQKIFLKVFNSSCSTLNAQLLSFTGNLSDNKSSLRWSTANENNLQQYVIEKSADGINFSALGTVSAKNTSNANYSFDDPDPIWSVAFYRLRLVNVSGNISFSKIIALYNNDATFTVKTKNPFRDNITLNIFAPSDGVATSKLYDIYGNVVVKKVYQVNKGTCSITIDDLSTLAKGMYILQTELSHTIVQTKLFKVN